MFMHLYREEITIYPWTIWGKFHGWVMSNQDGVTKWCCRDMDKERLQ